MLIGRLLNLFGLKRRVRHLLKFVLLIAQRVANYKHWCGEKFGNFNLAPTVYHNKLIADCNFADLNLTFVKKSTSVVKIQFHKDVQPLVVCLK